MYFVRVLCNWSYFNTKSYEKGFDTDNFQRIMGADNNETEKDFMHVRG